MSKKTQAFTLIELSIVLVIIGLIIGGVLVGRDLIEAAQIRSQAAQIVEVNAAVNTFKLKYNCLPGDCANVTQFFSGATQPTRTYNGDGNGIICGYSNVTWNASGGCDLTPGVSGVWGKAQEWMRVNDHLAAAKLIKLEQYNDDNAGFASSNLPGIGLLTQKIESKGGDTPGRTDHVFRIGGIAVGYEPALSYVPAGHKIRLGACRTYENFGGAGNWNDVTAFVCGLNPWEARMLDEKIDDGKPYTGNMVITSSFYIYRIQGGFTSNDTTNCANYAANRYLTESETTYMRNCAPSIKASF